jgi:hypothetical protein
MRAKGEDNSAEDAEKLGEDGEFYCFSYSAVRLLFYHTAICSVGY